jgi:hypothetical protein
MQNLISYRKELIQILGDASNLGSLPGNDKRAYQKFDSLFLGWYLGSDRYMTSGFPKHNVVSLEDLIYIGNRSGFKLSVQDLMDRCNALFRKFRPVGYIQEFSKYRRPIRIGSRHLQRLRRLYIVSDFENFSTDVDILTGVYGFLRCSSNHFGTPPEVMLGLPGSTPRNTIELFGTPMNTWTDKFCSPIPSIEKVFGSLGPCETFLTHLCSVDNMVKQRTIEHKAQKRHFTFMANPPFASELSTSFVKTLIDTMEKKADVIDFTIHVFLPVWDESLQIKVCEGGFNRGVEYPAYTALTTGRAKKFLVREDILDRDKFYYYDYFKERAVRVGHTTMHTLSTFTDKRKRDDIEDKCANMLTLWQTWTKENVVDNVNAKIKD